MNEAKLNRNLLSEDFHSKDFNLVDIVGENIRLDSSIYENGEVPDRVTKIRESFCVLRKEDSKRLRKSLKANLCIVELANILSAMAWDIEPNDLYRSSVICAEDLHRFILARRTVDAGYEGTTREFLCQRPISIEEINEILIGVIYAILYRFESSPVK
jgi:hypothetical protein